MRPTCERALNFFVRHAPRPNNFMTYKLKALVLLTSAFLSAHTGTASTVNWSLDDVAFGDGATASGNFDWDAASQSISNWNINVTSGVLSAFTYSPVDSTAGAYHTFSRCLRAHRLQAIRLRRSTGRRSWNSILLAPPKHRLEHGSGRSVPIR